MFAVAVLGLGGLVAGTTRQDAAAAPREVRIVARIDGVDELHLSANGARWLHEAFDTPGFVSINGQEWNPARQERLDAPPGRPFWDPDVDLAGAEVRLLRGRGEIDFRHGPEGLVIRFDDSRGGGTDDFEVLVEFAQELCSAARVVGDEDLSQLQCPRELRIEARVDGRDELYLSLRRADWLHLAWSWPTEVRVAGQPWNPADGPLAAPEGTGFLPYGIDLAEVKLELDKGRGRAWLEVAGGRLLVHFDDDAELGADDYVVRLLVPQAPRAPVHELPTGRAMAVELRHEPSSAVAGARLTVLALSPSRGEYLPWPGLRGMDFHGRCVVPLPAGTFRFEVLHRAGDRMTALRSEPVRITRSRSLSLPAARARTLDWLDDGRLVELRELALQSALPRGEVSWTRAEGGGDLELVVSPHEEFLVRALGLQAERDSGAGRHFLWWSQQRFGERGGLDSSAQPWIRCGFLGRDSAPLPPDCEGSLHSPVARHDFAIRAGTQLFTNRRFFGFSYRHGLADGGHAVFHPQQILLPELGDNHHFELGGELTAQGSVAVLLNENLGSPETRQLWWDLDLVDAGGRVLDVEASAIDWRAGALMRDGSPVPAAPLSEEGLAALGDPVKTIELHAAYRWDGRHEVQVDPAAHVVAENERYRALVPGHLLQRSRVYLDKARRIYAALELAREQPGTHRGPIELKWWLNGGAVGAWGSITMPIDGMTRDFDWFHLPWALAHESLHAFGYPHGSELERLENLALEEFERGKWAAEREPGFVPPGW